MNAYLTLPAAKRALNIAAANTDYDTLLMELIVSASRDLDAFCRRHFDTRSETRLFTPHLASVAFLDDLLSATTVSLIDPEDSTVDAVEYAAAVYQLAPLNGYPKLSIKLHSTASEVWVPDTACLEIAGVFGYGDGTSSPWLAAGITGTVATTTGTALTLSAAGTVEAGHTIKLGTEQMYVSAVVTTTATVRRGVNGTTAAAHSAAAISLAQYPAKIQAACRELVAMAFNRGAMAGQQSESIDGHAVSMINESDALLMLNRICSGYTRGI